MLFRYSPDRKGERPLAHLHSFSGVLHADETPVAMLKPGNGKTHRAYLWSYCSTGFNPMKAVVFDFADSRGGQHARQHHRAVRRRIGGLPAA